MMSWGGSRRIIRCSGSRKAKTRRVQPGHRQLFAEGSWVRAVIATVALAAPFGAIGGLLFGLAASRNGS
jgi:hypothetical protein